MTPEFQAGDVVEIPLGVDPVRVTITEIYLGLQLVRYRGEDDIKDWVNLDWFNDYAKLMFRPDRDTIHDIIGYDS
jgi:hypothetical protein